MAENEKTAAPAEETQEQLIKKERNVKILRFLQWIAAVLCLLLCASRFTREIRGTLGGAMLLIAGWVISPMTSDSDLLKKRPFAVKAAFQITVTAVLVIGGILIAGSN